MTGSFSRRRRAEGYLDPPLHALVAGAVALPLGRGPLTAAVGASFLIDLDHVVAARAIDPGSLWSLARRPPSHSASVAVVSGALVGAASGPCYGWAVFGGLLSHVLRDAVEGKTPLLWPFAGHEYAHERVLLAGSAGLLLGSWLISRFSAAGA
jgi:membrane-bound metal-dependent hydrolase YbcI (DUF457 family)